MAKRKATLLCVAAVAALASAPVALADTTDSSNWAGYAVHGNGVSFHSIVASWQEPDARCRRGHHTYSAMWIGLGGFALSSRALEQVGTELDCTRSSRVDSSAWYELIPQASRPIRMAVRPGDQVAAAVTVVGHHVTLALANLTTNASFQKSLDVSAIDVSSAEWIVEAPTECINFNACQVLPLANFGTATFTQAQAQTVDGHSGTISDGSWSSTKIRLRPGGRRFVVYHGTGASAGAAIPSQLAPGGSSFAVSFTRVRTIRNTFVPPRRTRVRAGYLVHGVLF